MATMSWAQRFSDTSIRFYERIRSREAAHAATAETSGSLSALDGHKYALVVTFRADGDPVPTPVWFGIAQGRLYFRSVSTGHKLGRLARNPSVLVAPCSANGRPTGAPFRARARLLATAEEEATAERAIRGNYGLARGLYARIISSRVPGRYVEVIPVGPATTGG